MLTELFGNSAELSGNSAELSDISAELSDNSAELSGTVAKLLFFSILFNNTIVFLLKIKHYAQTNLSRQAITAWVIYFCIV